MAQYETLKQKLDSLLHVGYVGRFLSVGVVGALFDNLILLAVVEIGLLSPVVGKVVSAESSIVLMFLVNEYWTFSGHGDRTRLGFLRRLVTSNVVRLGGLGVGFVVLFGLHNQFGVWYLLANVVGIGVGFVVNYVAEFLVTWNVN